MRMFIIGASGLIGYNLYNHAQRANNFSVIGTCHTQLKHDLVPFDIRLESIKNIDGKLTEEDCVVLCSAIVGNDKVLANPGLARKVNVDGTLNCAEEALAAGAQVIFLSSDAVFNDRITTGYQEINLPSPLTTYGKQKAMVENALSTMKGRVSIVRTGWVVGYGSASKDPIQIAYNGMLSSNGIKLADDLLTTLTDIEDLSKAIHRIAIGKHYQIQPTCLVSRFHVATNPPTSWLEIGKRIKKSSWFSRLMSYTKVSFDDLKFIEPRSKSAWIDSTLTCGTLALQPKGIDAMIQAKVQRLDEMRQSYAGHTASLDL